MNKFVLGGLAVLIVIVGLIVGAFFIGQTLVDILLILAALISLAAFAALGFAAFQLVGIAKEIRDEVKTIVGAAQETLTEVQGTARFVNDSVVAPVARVAGFASATRATIRSFTEPLFKRKS